MEHLSNDQEDCPNQHGNSHKLCNEKGDPIFSLLQSQWHLRQQQDQNFPMEESHCRANTIVSEEINKSKRTGLQESQSGIRVGKLTISVRSFEMKKL